MRYEVIELNAAVDRVKLCGRLDSATVEAVELPFTATLAGSDGGILLDLTELEFLSSLGIRLLISAARVVRRRGRRFVMVGAQPGVAEVLATLALDSVLPLAASEAEALEMLGA